MAKQRVPDLDYPWSPDLAYAVGLIVTDGNLSKDNRHINFKSVDYELVRSIQRILAPNNRISTVIDNRTNRKPAFVLQFSNVRMYRWLERIGISKAKTYTVGAVKIPTKYYPDFLRGHLDGDGNIMTFIDRYNIYKGKVYSNTRVITRFVSVSETHIRWLHEKVFNHSPVRGAMFRSKIKGRSDMWVIKFSKYESLKLFPWLYYKKEIPALQRKRIIADQLLNKISNGKLR